MQTTDSDDLSDLERRLTAHQPSSEGLNTDAMLFAAGRAAARTYPGRFIWPAMTGLMSVAVVILSVMLTQERSQKILLVQRLQEQRFKATPAPQPSFPASVAPAEIPSVAQSPPDSLRVAQRALERGLDEWAWVPEPKAYASRHSTEDSAVFSVGQRDKLLDL